MYKNMQVSLEIKKKLNNYVLVLVCFFVWNKNNKSIQVFWNANNCISSCAFLFIIISHFP